MKNDRRLALAPSNTALRDTGRSEPHGRCRGTVAALARKLRVTI